MTTSRLLVAALLTATIGCSSSMPRDPARSSYASRLSAEKNRYYISLRDGALSRILAIQPESVAWNELKSMARHWQAISALSRAEAIVSLLRTEGLAVLVIRLDQALRSTVNRRPRPLKTSLEADALKQALLEAYRRLEKEG